MERGKKKIGAGRKMPKNQNKNIWLCALIGGGIGLAATLFSALAAPLLLLRTGDPNSLITAAMVVCMLIGGVIGGTVTAKQYKEAPVLAGIISAAMILVPLAIVSLFLPEGIDLLGLLFGIGAVCGGSCGSAYIIKSIASDKKRNMKKVLKHR